MVVCGGATVEMDVSMAGASIAALAGAAPAGGSVLVGDLSELGIALSSSAPPAAASAVLGGCGSPAAAAAVSAEPHSSWWWPSRGRFGLEGEGEGRR